MGNVLVRSAINGFLLLLIIIIITLLHDRIKLLVEILFNCRLHHQRVKDVLDHRTDQGQQYKTRPHSNTCGWGPRGRKISFPAFGQTYLHTVGQLM